jgi:large subunit ribosomal protein L10
MSKRPEKISMLNEVRTRVKDSVFVILADFTGMSQEKDFALRAKLRAVKGEFHVVRNQMFRHVVREMNVPKLEEGLNGPTALITGSGDVAETVKALKEFIKEKELPVIKMGSLDGVFLSKEQVESLANLPSKPQLYAQLLGLLLAPARNLVTLLNQAVAQVPTVLAAVEEKKKTEQAS